MRPFLLTLLFVSLIPASGFALDMKAIQDHYRGLTKLKAEVEQTKTSPLLIRPLKSLLTLEYSEKTLSWSMKGQEPWKVRFDGKGQAQVLSNDKALAEIPREARAKLDRTLGLIHKILVMDPSLEKDFTQTLTQQTLSITPKSKDHSVFFEGVEVTFKSNADIDFIILRTADDETRLSFRSLELKR